MVVVCSVPAGRADGANALGVLAWEYTHVNINDIQFDEPMPEPPALKVRITYNLSEAGRRDSLRKGGNGQRQQDVEIYVYPEDLDLFTVNETGEASFDVRICNVESIEDPPFGIPLGKGRFEFEPWDNWKVEWDVVPEPEDLLALGRDIRAYEHERQLEGEAYALEKERKGEEFISDPNARAASIEREHVNIEGGHRFENSHQVALFARRRATADQEAQKKANRATLTEWIQKNGSKNQQERLAANLLPWQEAFATVEHYLFTPLAGFKLCERFDPAEVCMCERAGSDACEPKFQSLDATELTADEWDDLSRIKEAAPGATFQLREHRATCKSHANPEVRRGVIVKFTLGQLTFKREFALENDIPF